MKNNPAQKAAEEAARKYAESRQEFADYEENERAWLKGYERGVADTEERIAQARAAGMAIAFQECLFMWNVRRKRHNNSFGTSLLTRIKEANAQVEVSDG